MGWLDGLTLLGFLIGGTVIVGILLMAYATWCFLQDFLSLD